MEEKLQELFNKISKITDVKDIAYHRFVNGELMPVSKIETDNLKVNDWKNAHSKLRVKISDEPIIMNLIKNKNSIAIDDVSKNRDSSQEFFHFRIKSIAVIPVLDDTNQAFGMIVIASIGKLTSFNDDIIKKCEDVVSEYNYYLLNCDG